ncbi:MAG: MBOAT family protein, partial [Anaerolineae bacterium]|nr:MBOAT family protein [Anaerolineae bacterium]
FLATLFFAFQIYCDFSGYSDIAIGAARIMGFRLMENFRRPYLAQSPSEFWRRWHITLSTWFRDYVYIPLGGNRVAVPRWYLNLMVVFVVSGLWHGAAWTFVLWGGLHGLYVVGEATTREWRGLLADMFGLSRRPALQAGVNGLVTFSLVCLAWLFFRANTVADAFLLLGHFLPLSNFAEVNAPWIAVVGNPSQEMALALGLIGLLLTVHWVQERQWQFPLFFQRPLWFRWATYLGLALATMNLGITEEVPFIYFQF